MRPVCTAGWIERSSTFLVLPQSSGNANMTTNTATDRRWATVATAKGSLHWTNNGRDFEMTGRLSVQQFEPGLQGVGIGCQKEDGEGSGVLLGLPLDRAWTLERPHTLFTANGGGRLALGFRISFEGQAGLTYVQVVMPLISGNTNKSMKFARRIVTTYETVLSTQGAERDD